MAFWTKFSRLIIIINIAFHALALCFCIRCFFFSKFTSIAMCTIIFVLILCATINLCLRTCIRIKRYLLKFLKLIPKFYFKYKKKMKILLFFLYLTRNNDNVCNVHLNRHLHIRINISICSQQNKEFGGRLNRNQCNEKGLAHRIFNLNYRLIVFFFFFFF